MKRAFIILLLPLIYFLFVEEVLSIFVADLYHVQSVAYLNEKEIDKALSASSKSVSANPIEPSYRRQKAKVILAKKVLASGLSAKDYQDSAKEELQIAQQLNQRNLATLRNSIPLYYYLQSDYDSETNKEIKTHYAWLKSTYPDDLGLLVDIAQNEKKLGFYDDYEKTKILISGLRPELLKWHEVFK